MPALSRATAARGAAEVAPASAQPQGRIAAATPYAAPGPAVAMVSAHSLCLRLHHGKPGVEIEPGPSLPNPHQLGVAHLGPGGSEPFGAQPHNESVSLDMAERSLS